MARGFQYHKLSESKLQERANQTAGTYQGFILDKYPTYRSVKGNHFIRILPPTWSYPDGSEGDHYGMDVWVHYSVGPDNASVLCLQKMKNESCPLCEQRIRAERSGDEDKANELKPVRRVLMWVINKNEQKGGPVVWACPWTVEKEIARQSRDNLTGTFYDIVDPDEGYDISFEREGDGRMAKYTSMQLSRKQSSVPKHHLDYIQENPLQDTLRWRTAEEIKRLYEGVGEDDDDDAPPRRRSTEDDDRRSSRRTEDDDRKVDPPWDDDDSPRRPARSAREDDDSPRRTNSSRTDDDDVERDRGAVGQRSEDVQPPSGRDRSEQMRRRYSNR